MIELSKETLVALKKLKIPKDEVCLWAVIEGRMGRAWVDNTDEPNVGLVAVADFCFLLGDPVQTEVDYLVQLLFEHGKNQIIVFESPVWKTVLEKYFPENHVDFKRYAFNWEPEAFDRVQLGNYILQLPPEYSVIPFTHELGLKALENNFTADFCMFFESVDVFMRDGLGYAVVKGDTIIAGASSYSACQGAIDITIGTLPEYRQQGLALACASKLILDCLDRGIYPRWDAANLNSVALAKKLGYSYKDEYTVYTIK